MALSDPLLVNASADDLPRTREEAIAAMRGSVKVDWGREIVLYWEVYGLESQERVEVSVAVAGEREGTMTRILSALGIPGRGGRAGRLPGASRRAARLTRWRSRSTFARWRTADYTLALVASTANGASATAERHFKLDVR